VTELHRSEAEFHDALALDLEPEQMPPAAPDHLEEALYRMAGDLADRTVLELGCGKGDITLHLLASGAAVTALDLSSRMLEVARRRSARFFPGAAVRFVRAPAEATGLSDADFDIVVGKWILHHVDVATVGREVRRVLKPGGFAIFIENSNTNALLRFARNHLIGRFGIPRYGTVDEHPLDEDDYRKLEGTFSRVQVSYPDFFFLRLFDRQVLKARSPRLSRLLAAADDTIWRHVFRLRRYSFHVILRLER